VVALPREPAPLGPLPGDVRPTREALVLDIDPARDRFGGTAELAIHLDRPRDQIWLHGRGLAVHGVTVTAAGASIVARWDEVDPIGVARISLPAPVSGDVTVRIAFDAAYDPSLVGVYRVETAAGPAVFSKFEAIYARRGFPCFDEPAFKIPFDVTLTVPSGAVVVANMPVASEAAQATTRRVQFRATPPLPSYLIAFAVGPFEQRTTELAGNAIRAQALPISALALRGRGDDTAFALAEEPALLAEQERYFGVAFPFPKLDLIAVPDFQSGAMENAGAITFRDSALLVDDKITSLAQRIGVTSVLAHETAHQWFGDLVTMRWWDDLWLNEGFATFLDTRTLRAVRPEIEAELDAVDGVNEVMNLDSLASARRIRQPIETTHDITNAFDGITYRKGAAVLAMLEHYIGDEPFRAGLHDFLVAHASGNATTDELVRALSAAAGTPLAPLVSSFLDQPGVPVVAAHLRCEAGRGTVELGQSRWRPLGATPAPATARDPASPGGDARWVIPVCVRAGIGARIEQVCTVLDAATGTLALPACADWILPNAGAAGYYRSTLPPEDLARLRDRGLRKLPTVERVAFGHDLVAAFRSGALPGDEVLRALEPLARDGHGAVAMAPLGLLRFVDELMVTGKARQVLRARIARLYAPALAALGWRPAPSDRPWRRLFRTQLIDFLALGIGDPAVLGEAARLGRRLLGVDRDQVRHADAAPDLAGTAMAAAARTGGVEVFDALVALLVGSADAQLRSRALVALGATRDPALIRRALDLALDPRLRQNERLVTFRVLAGAVETRDLAWAWLEASFDALVPMLPDRYGGQLPSAIKICDPAWAERVRAFFTPRIASLTGGPRNLAQALETATQCAARVAAQHDSVARYVR
jgi:cytosol alanyl aminopeptidase